MQEVSWFEEAHEESHYQEEYKSEEKNLRKINLLLCAIYLTLCVFKWNARIYTLCDKNNLHFDNTANIAFYNNSHIKIAKGTPKILLWPDNLHLLQ